MKIVFAPDSFKESLTAAEAAAAMQRGFAKVFPQAEYICMPMADGGEGTADALVNALNGEWISAEVHDPLGRPISARYGLLPGGRAVIEMAEAAGLHLVAADERNPLHTSTFGVGQLILDALSRGCRHIILGLGGSATNDAGAGMLQALGFKLLDQNGHTLPVGGAALAGLSAVNDEAVPAALRECHFEVACDVTNPLCGAQGASAIFGPQKGATPQMVAALDTALSHYADIIAAHGFVDSRDQAGSGAAGGMGFTLRSVLNAQLLPGIEMVMAETDLNACLKGADLVVTGEGRMDGQTAFGKVPSGVLKAAQAQNIAVIGIAGSVGGDAAALKALGFKAVFPTIAAPASLTDILASAAHNVERTAEHVAEVLQLGMNWRTR